MFYLGNKISFTSMKITFGSIKKHLYPRKAALERKEGSAAS